MTTKYTATREGRKATICLSFQATTKKKKRKKPTTSMMKMPRIIVKRRAITSLMKIPRVKTSYTCNL